MKIAIDGGAFQQGLAAGIFNVAVGLLNAIVERRPNFTIVLVTDPIFGSVNDHLLSRLSFRPEIIEGELGPSYPRSPRILTTKDPKIKLEVDGVLVSYTWPTTEVTYTGPVPTKSFRILSRADSPSATSGSGDARCLGVAIEKILVQDEKASTLISINDPRLQVGFNASEITHRWTNGAAELPIELFSSFSGIIDVKIHLSSTMIYRLGNGLFDEHLAMLTRRIDQVSILAENARVEKQLIEKGVSAFITNHFIPTRFEKIPSYAILYDMIPVIFPEYFFADAQENFSDNISVFQNAEHVFSISDASRADLIEFAKVDPAHVTTMSIDIDRDFEPASMIQIAEARARYGLSDRTYFLTVGTLEPRKNHATLIKAYAKVLQGGIAHSDLVIVGKPGWGTDSLYALVSELGLQDRVHFLTTVTNEDLAALYSGSLFLAYISIYEGFGLPIIEAMACGCPVLTSNSSSMPEVAGDAALIVDSKDMDSIVGGLYALLTNSYLRTQLAERGLQNRRRFSWHASAARVLRVLERN